MGLALSLNWPWWAILGTAIAVATCLASILRQSLFSARIKKDNKLFRRPIARLLRGGRTSQLKGFERIATDVICDVESALEPPSCQKHARSFLPILCDVRRRGQHLLTQQTGAHRVSSPERERLLQNTVDRLNQLEQKLKALPKPTVTVEEVLLGKFE